MSERYIDRIYPLDGHVLLESTGGGDGDVLICSVYRVGVGCPGIPKGRRSSLAIGDEVLCPRSKAHRVVRGDRHFEEHTYYIARAADLVAFVKPKPQ